MTSCGAVALPAWRLAMLMAVEPGVVIAKLTDPLLVTAPVMSSSTHAPELTAGDEARTAPIDGAFEYVIPASVQVLSATAWTATPALEPVLA